ncbi:phosphotransferase [Tessaracoccus sp. Z1128]
MTSEDSALLQQLWDLAVSSRWFSGRGGRPVDVELGPWAGPTLRPALLVVEFDDGHRERFHVPLLYRDGAPIDACDEGGVLLRALYDEAPGFERYRAVANNLTARRYAGEQSNTSVFFGDQLLVKVFRRLEPGRSVDVELHAALAGTGVVAELYGAWTWDGTDLAVFLEALPQPTDGYVLACEYAGEGRDFTDHARALGEALATVHTVLAQRLATGTVDGAQLAADCRARFAAVADEVPEVAPYREAADAAFAAISDARLPAQRVHGDCHLGQVLLSEGRWRYVDFEGEPLKTMAERRLPDSPLRDVAGMLRSFAYAQAAGGASAQWLAGCREAFLSGYGLDPHAEDPVLAAYETDKAGYEAVYEARFRPHLLSVPLQHLATLITIP